MRYDCIGKLEFDFKNLCNLYFKAGLLQIFFTTVQIIFVFCSIIKL